jgi:hypothetical protein
MIDVTGVDLVKFAQKAYELSSPQGFGFFHFTPEPLAEDRAAAMVEREGHCALSMDYVDGRACKITVFRKGDKLEICDSWYDHTDEQLKKLLEAFDIKFEAASEHGCACNCAKCRVERHQPAYN